MQEGFKPSSLGELPGVGDVVYVDRLDAEGNIEIHVDNGQLARNPSESGDIYIAAESGSRAGGHPVHSISEVLRDSVDRTRFLLVTKHGAKYLLRTGKLD